MRSDKQFFAEFAELKEQLAAAIRAMMRLVEKKEAASFTIAEFCSRNRISESQYHKLQNEGRGPRLMRTGSDSVRISRAAEEDWIREREAEAEQRKDASEVRSTKRRKSCIEEPPADVHEEATIP